MALALAGCDRGVQGGATVSAVEPGRPGTGNGIVEVAPAPESIPESPQVGGTTMHIPDGVTGSGGPGETMRSQPGVGLDGGLGDRPAPARQKQAG